MAARVANCVVPGDLGTSVMGKWGVINENFKGYFQPNRMMDSHQTQTLTRAVNLNCPSRTETSLAVPLSNRIGALHY